MTNYRTKLGHTHLKVRDLTRSIDFYMTYFDLNEVEKLGDHFAFLSGGTVHHEIALQSVGPDAPAAPPGAVGLFHVAFEVEDKDAFARAYQALTDAGVPAGAVDHGISWAIYFNDPDGNGLEIYVDTRADIEGRERWHGNDRRLSRARILEAASQVSA